MAERWPSSMLILASASPRRHELLLAAGIDHVVRPANILEERYRQETPADFVRRLAEEKARAVEAQASDVVLGADTVVCVGDEVLGKPRNDADSFHMLRLLSGRSHRVLTGICLLRGVTCIRELASTEVCLAELTNEDIWEYTQSGEPADKAGGYAIQGLASKFVLSIKGSYTNVVGLPVSLVYQHLKTLSL